MLHTFTSDIYVTHMYIDSYVTHM